MSSGTKAPAADQAEAAASTGRTRLMLMLAVAVVLAGAAAGLWFAGLLPRLPGLGPKPLARTAGYRAASDAPPTYLDVPEIITNLNVPGRRQSFLKLHATLELGSARDVAGVTEAMPRILDLFQTYLRDMRPEELRGSEGSYRLREELVGRAGVAAAPAQVRDVLFKELIIQ